MKLHASRGTARVRSTQGGSGLVQSWITASGLHRRGLILGALANLTVLAWPFTVSGQAIQTYFPSGVSGYDQQLGVTVLSRLRPLYDTPGLRVGSFVFNPSLDESLFYNSNFNGTPGSSSWGSHTSGSVLANSDWGRNKLAASAGFSNYQLFSLPNDNYTDWNVGLDGGYTIGDGLLEAAYSHQAYHQLGTAIGTVSSTTPVLDQTDTAHLGYSFVLGRLTLTPDLSASAYRFGNATVLGVPISQQFLNRNVVAGSVTSRYSMSDVGGIVVVLGATNSDFISPQPGQPSNNSHSIQLLGGFDYQAKGAWRYRLLAGVEVRAFEASQYGTRTAPIVEGGVIWTPTNLTTVTGSVSRAVEDPQFGGTNGFIYNQVRLVVDYEYKRNIFLQARSNIQYAQYLQSGGGSQTGFGAGVGATWLLNRNLRLSLDYDYAQLTGSTNSVNPLNLTTVATRPYTQSVAALTLHFAL
jgi:hypothetical protein